jgi:hypothetical protein
MKRDVARTAPGVLPSGYQLGPLTHSLSIESGPKAVGFHAKPGVQGPLRLTLGEGEMLVYASGLIQINGEPASNSEAADFIIGMAEALKASPLSYPVQGGFVPVPVEPPTFVEEIPKVFGDSGLEIVGPHGTELVP